MTDDFKKWTDLSKSWSNPGAGLPTSVREDLIKSKYKAEDASRNVRAYLEDPLAINYAMGYKDRKFSMSFDVSKQIVQNLSLVAGIIQTRTNQVGAFATPYRMSKSVGYAIKHKNPARLTTKGEREMVQSLEKFVYNCGASEPNKFDEHRQRDDFEAFLKKIVRDSLMYDQFAAEVVPDKSGQPYEFLAIDASTIRLASKTDSVRNWLSDVSDSSSVPLAAKIDPTGIQYPFRTMNVQNDHTKDPAFLQIVHGQIANIYSADELMFGIRNPRTDIYIQGYGYSEVEQLVSIITSHLYAEEYNRNFFKNGSAPKGLLVFRGDSMSPDQLEGFKRQWKANLEGVHASWRTPIMQSEQGVDWVNLNQSNKDMEYGQWMEYLIKITCFTGDSLVTMADGSQKTINSVQPGELVLTHTGKSKKVKNVQISPHTGLLHHIKAGETIEVTGEHPMYVAGASGKPEWKAAKDIVAAYDYLCIPKEGYDSSKLPTDAGKIYEDEGYFFVPVSETWTTEYDGDVYNLEVADEHTYQVHRFAVHNCAVFLIDPAELNFDLHGGVSQTPLFESSQEWKLKASRDKGLKPMLRFIAKHINNNIISQIDDNFVFDFVGLDELTEQEKHTLRTEQVQSYMTLNEIRRAEDLPDLDHGDMPMNPTYLQAIQTQMQVDQQAQQQEQSQGSGAQAPPPDPNAASDGGEDEQLPNYSDNFTKSLSTDDQLSDDYNEWESLVDGEV